MTTAATAGVDIGGKRAGHVPGERAIWLFVLGDMVIFSAYLIIYLFYRGWNLEQFQQSQALLSQRFGLLNTLVLITSSWFAALAVQAARQGNHARAANLIALCGASGILFCLIKTFEWSSKIGQGLTIETDEFFGFYYMLTGTHLYHVVMGLGLLVMVWRELKTAAQPRMSQVEIGATFSHMVDLLWIVIYALVYLLR